MMKKRNFRLMLVAFVCSLIATTVFTSCGDDDETTSATGYTYYVEPVISPIPYEDSEKNVVENALKQAVGYSGTMYKVYETRQDEQIKAECDALKRQYTNLSSVYFAFKIYCKNTATYQEELVATYEFGKCLTTPYAVMTIGYAHDKDRIKAVKDSLLSLRTAADSAKWDTWSTANGNSVWNIQVDFNQQLKEVLGKYCNDNYLEQNCNKAFLEQIASAHANDSLFIDYYVEVCKRKIPNGNKEVYWSKIFKANLK